MSSVLNVLCDVLPSSLLYGVYASLSCPCCPLYFCCLLFETLETRSLKACGQERIQALLDLKNPSLKPVILAKQSQFGASCVPQELQPEH